MCDYDRFEYDEEQFSDTNDEEKFPIHSIEQSLDRSRGNGSGSYSDTRIDETSSYHNEWNSQAATTFDPNDADDPQKWRDLKNDYQNRLGEQPRPTFLNQKNLERDIEIATDRLHFSQNQIIEVNRIFDKIDLDAIGSPRLESAILAVLTLAYNRVGHKDREKRLRPSETFETREEDVKAYKSLREDWNITPKQVTNTRKLINSQL